MRMTKMRKTGFDNSFYFHCIVCDRELDEFEQVRGGGECSSCRNEIGFTIHELEYGNKKIEYDIYRMWNPPMGDHDEFFDNFSDTDENY